MTIAATPRLMEQRPFVLFWWSRLASVGAFHMQGVAIGWQVYDLTGSAFDLGLVGLIQFVPVVLLTFPIGHVVDRYNRHLIIRLSLGVTTLATAMLALGSAMGWLTKEFLFAIVFVVATARAFETPTWQAIIPGLVPQRLVPRAIASAASAGQAAVICGPALGGLVYAVDPLAVYVLCTASFLAALVLLMAIRAGLPVGERKPLTFETLFAGVTFIRNRRVLFGIISLDLFAVLLGGATALLPIFAKDILGTGPWGLGLLRSAPALGALVASVILTRYPINHSLGRVMFACVGLFGAATVVFGLSTWFPLSLVALTVLGAADAVSVVIRFALVQVETPDQMLGRVSAINSLFTGTSNTLGDFRAGLMAAWFGAVTSVLVGGIGTLLVALIWMRLFPELLAIKRFEKEKEDGA
jgi:MFS family permease